MKMFCRRELKEREVHPLQNCSNSAIKGGGGPKGRRAVARGVALQT